MNDLEPTPTAHETPPAPADPVRAYPAALTGVAGMLIGGLLLGKRGGLLAGLVGMGAKVWLEKIQALEPAATEPVPPAPLAETEIVSHRVEKPAAFPNLAELAASVVQRPAPEPAPVALPTPQPAPAPSAAELDDPLDLALARAEGFRNFGEPLSETLPPILEPEEAIWADLIPRPIADEEPAEDTANFVQWPSPPIASAEPAALPDPVFQEFLATMFREAEPTPPTASSHELSAPPISPSLTPEDIWKLAAAEPRVFTTPAPTMLEPIPEPVAFTALATPPVDQTADPLVANVSDLDAFTELFGPDAEAAAQSYFAHTDAGKSESFFHSGAALQKPMPLLTSEEEAALTASEAPLEPIVAPTDTPFLNRSELAPVIPALLHFAPRAVPLMNRPLDATSGAPVGKIIFLLILLAMLFVSYVFRDALQKQWLEWFPPAPSANASPPTSIKESPAPTPPVPAPATPESAPAPMPDPPAPPLPEKIEVRPAAALPELPAEPDPAPPPANPQDSPEDSARRDAEAAVKSFLSATTISDLLTHTLNADKVAEEITKYYGGNAVEPTPFDNIVVDSGARVPDTKSRAFLFRVRSPERPQGFPVCTEETPQGYRVEWEAFIQCRDRAVAKFWKNPEAPSQTLFVVLKRSHYFEEDIPNLDDYEVFSITSPNPDEDTNYAFAKKSSPFAQKYRARLEWDKSYFIVAKFAQVKLTTGNPHVEMQEIERFNWRTQGN